MHINVRGYVYALPSERPGAHFVDRLWIFFNTIFVPCIRAIAFFNKPIVMPLLHTQAHFINFITVNYSAR